MTPEVVTELVLGEVGRERRSQDEKWGEQNHPDGTGALRLVFGQTFVDLARLARIRCDEKHRAGEGTWLDIALEEFAEAMAEDDPEKLRAELIQVAAVAVAWIECIDRRSGEGSGACTS